MRQWVEKFGSEAGLAEPNPRRRVGAAVPNRKWAADITYVPTDEGWLYLASVIDLCSRKVVGWAMADHMRADLVADADRLSEVDD